MSHQCNLTGKLHMYANGIVWNSFTALVLYIIGVHYLLKTKTWTNKWVNKWMNCLQRLCNIFNTKLVIDSNSLIVLENTRKWETHAGE